MSRSTNIRLTLVDKTLAYIKENNVSSDEYIQRESAVVFRETSLHHNFHPDVWKNISNSDEWNRRLLKQHSHLEKGFAELGSCNSSDAILMNVFAHPKATMWKGLSNVLGLDSGFSVEDIHFGVNPEVDEGKHKSEIDLVIGKLHIEAKLTESDFTEKAVDTVNQKYPAFRELFDMERLTHNDKVRHYQLLRNIFAVAADSERRFLLLVDERRSDLIRSFLEVIQAVKSPELRYRCSFVTWQEIADVVGRDLREYLVKRYGH